MESFCKQCIYGLIIKRSLMIICFCCFTSNEVRAISLYITMWQARHQSKQSVSTTSYQRYKRHAFDSVTQFIIRGYSHFMFEVLSRSNFVSQLSTMKTPLYWIYNNQGYDPTFGRYFHWVVLNRRTYLNGIQTFIDSVYLGLPRVREKSGKILFFQGQGIVREFEKMSGKFWKGANVREMSGNFM